MSTLGKKRRESRYLTPHINVIHPPVGQLLQTPAVQPNIVQSYMNLFSEDLKDTKYYRLAWIYHTENLSKSPGALYHTGALRDGWPSQK